MAGIKEYVSGIKVDIILGMTKGTGLTQKKHDKICSLIKRLNSVSGMPQISCNYIVEGKQVHSKVYIWCRGRKAIEAFRVQLLHYECILCKKRMYGCM